jgi:hypothetical protein
VDVRGPSDAKFLPALRMKPAPIGIKGDLATLGRAASFGSARLPCHSGVGLGGESTHKLGASHREEGCCVDEVANHVEDLLKIRCRSTYGH